MGSPLGDGVVTPRVCTSPASREGDLHGGALPAAPALSAQVWRGVGWPRAGLVLAPVLQACPRELPAQWLFLGLCCPLVPTVGRVFGELVAMTW